NIRSEENHLILDMTSLKNLQKQEYMAPIPKSLWLKMQLLLNGTERSIWQYIYAEYTKNVSKHDKERPVVISRKKLGMYISRGSTAVQNTLASLREKGWLITEEQYSTKSG